MSGVKRVVVEEGVVGVDDVWSVAVPGVDLVACIVAAALLLLVLNSTKSCVPKNLHRFPCRLVDCTEYIVKMSRGAVILTALGKSGEGVISRLELSVWVRG